MCQCESYPLDPCGIHSETKRHHELVSIFVCAIEQALILPREQSRDVIWTICRAIRQTYPKLPPMGGGGGGGSPIRGAQGVAAGAISTLCNHGPGAGSCSRCYFHGEASG